MNLEVDLKVGLEKVSLEQDFNVYFISIFINQYKV